VGNCSIVLCIFIGFAIGGDWSQVLASITVFKAGCATIIESPYNFIESVSNVLRFFAGGETVSGGFVGRGASFPDWRVVWGFLGGGFSKSFKGAAGGT
jgi:hypothetical protein